MARILVVDDDSALRQALGAVLHRNGYEIEQAENGAEALKKSLDGPFDAAVVDYQSDACDQPRRALAIGLGRISGASSMSA